MLAEVEQHRARGLLAETGGQSTAVVGHDRAQIQAATGPIGDLTAPAEADDADAIRALGGITTGAQVGHRRSGLDRVGVGESQRDVGVRDQKIRRHAVEQLRGHRFVAGLGIRVGDRLDVGGDSKNLLHNQNTATHGLRRPSPVHGQCMAICSGDLQLVGME